MVNDGGGPTALGVPVPPPLKEEEAAHVVALRNALAPLLLPDSAAARFCTDACLCRYLRARAWDVKKATKLLKGTLEWRVSAGVDALLFREVQEEGATGKMARLKRPDRSGRPVLLLRPSLENTRGADRQIRNVIYNMETMVASTAAGLTGDAYPRGSGVDLSAEQICLLVDFTGYSVFNAPPSKTTMETLHILQHHYPERLGSAVVFAPPTLFSVLWALVGPFLDARTVAKIHFVDPTKEAGRALHASLFDLAHLHTSMGGSCTEPDADGYLPWDTAAYDAWVQEEEAKRKDLYYDAHDTHP